MSKGREIKPHIAVFGKRNNGKSSIINALARQNVSIVSDIAGTTTDPVKKSIEIPGIGPVIVIDTAGVDDDGTLGHLRIHKTREMIDIIDLALLVITDNELGYFESELIKEFKKQDIPFFIVHNKNDIHPLRVELIEQLKTSYHCDVIVMIATTGEGIEPLLILIRQYLPLGAFQYPTMLGGLVKPGDIVMLITPIDIEAPQGRLILPQVQTIRDILDNDCISIILKERETEAFLKNSPIKPALVICDTSVILKADAMISKEIPLTGFSILLARFKGNFPAYLQGTPTLSKLKNGDHILLLESCTHHVSCDDIGRIKIPRWISQFTGKQLHFDVVAGLDMINDDIKKYALVIQCGGCMITRRQLYARLKPALDVHIPVTNYGMAIAYVQGVYNRAIAPFVKEVFTDYL